jgi:fucose permease
VALRSLADPARRPLLLGGFLAFLMVGASQALYGPAFPVLRERFGLNAAEVGLVVSLHFLGSFTTIALSGWILRRFGYRWTLVVGSLVMAAGAVLVALQASWLLTLAGALAIGLGFGAVDVAMNLLFVRSFGEGSAPALNLLNAMFGIGAVLGPLAVAVALPTLAVPFLGVAVAAVLVAALMVRVEEPPELPPGDHLALSWTRVIGFVLIYFLYVSSEVGVASWETEYLTPHVGAGQAAALPAVFWGAMTVGRFLSTPISAWVRSRDLVLGASALALVAAVAAHWVPAAPWAYAVVGLAFAPIFPTTLVWLAEVFPRRAEQITPIAVAAANLGPVATAPLIGVSVELASSDVIPTAIAVLCAMLAASILVTWIGTRRG